MSAKIIYPRQAPSLFRRRFRFVLPLSFVLPLILLPLSLIAGNAESWPAFRGAAVDGVSKEQGVFQGKRHLALETRWTAPLGSGYSGCVADEGVVVTMFTDGTNDLVAGFAMDSGKELWRAEIGPMYKGHDGSHDGPIATPAIHDGHVFSISAQGKLFARELKTGKELWQVDVQETHKIPKPWYGFGASPLVTDGVLVMLLGGEGTAIGGFDPKTGEKLWMVGSDRINYQGLVPWRYQDRDVLLAAGDTKLFAIDPKKGELLFELAHNGNGGRGATSLIPVPCGKSRIFLAHQDDASTLVEIKTVDGKPQLEQVWETRAIRNSYNVPIYHEGHLYAYSSRFLTCVDVADGKPKWRSRPPGDGFLILVDGHLVLQTKQGSVHVAEASPEAFREKARLEPFSKQSWSPPGFAAGSIITRSFGQLARLDVVEPEMAVSLDQATERAEGTDFGKFLAKVRRAKSSAKKTKLVDAFLAKHKTMPIVESDGWVHFLYRGSAKDVALAGDMFGARQERAMHHLAGTDLFYYSMQLPLDAMVAYLFIVNYGEMVDDPRNPNKTVTTMVGKDMEMSFTGEAVPMSVLSMPKWQSPEYLVKEAAPERRGKLERHEIESAKLKAKVAFDVYLPAGYDKGEERYPLAIVHGGKATREKGKWPQALNHLIGDSVAPTIVVLVDMFPSFEARQYGPMIAEELCTFVDEKYRTRSEPDQRANIGFGVTGLNALMITLGHPKQFAKVGTESGMFMDYVYGMVTPQLAQAADAKFEFHLGWSAYDLRNPDEAWDLSRANREMAKFLEGKGYKVTKKEVPEGTDWTSWRNRTGNIMSALFPLKNDSM